MFIIQQHKKQLIVESQSRLFRTSSMSYYKNNHLLYLRTWLSSVYQLSCLGFIGTQPSLSALTIGFISKFRQFIQHMGIEEHTELPSPARFLQQIHILCTTAENKTVWTQNSGVRNKIPFI